MANLTVGSWFKKQKYFQYQPTVLKVDQFRHLADFYK